MGPSWLSEENCLYYRIRGRRPGGGGGISYWNSQFSSCEDFFFILKSCHLTKMRSAFNQLEPKVIHYVNFAFLCKQIYFVSSGSRQMNPYFLFFQNYKEIHLQVSDLCTYTGWSQKKFMMWSRGKVFEKFQNIVWRSLSLYIFTSSQEVRAF